MRAKSRKNMLIHAVYNIIKAYAMHYALREGRGRHVTMFYCGLLVVAASAVYLVYSVYIFAFGCDSTYHMYVAIGIAAITTYELIVAVHGLRNAKKRNDIFRETVKYINLASALVSVSLTQTAILSFTNETDMSEAYAVGVSLTPRHHFTSKERSSLHASIRAPGGLSPCSGSWE